MATTTQSVWSRSAPPGATKADPFRLNTAARLLKPSFADCFFIALLAWLFVCGASGWKALLADGDTGWHIRTGQYILAHHSVPTRDLFSFSKPNAAWFAWEWLSDVGLAVLFKLGGLKAIVLCAGTLVAVYATILLRFSLWLGSNALVAAMLTLVAVGASSMHFLARPHLVTLILLPSCLWLLEIDTRKKTRWLWVLIPVSALWTNMHGGVFMFFACLGLVAAGSAIEAWLGRKRWQLFYRQCVVLVGCSLASLANPYGIGLHIHVFQYLQSDWIKNLIQEFQAPTFRSEGQLQFEGLLLVGLMATGLLFRSRRVSEGLCVLFLAHSSLISVRHAPLFAAVAAPLIGREFSAWWRTWAANSKKKSVVRILEQLGQDITPGFRRNTIWPAVVVIALAAIGAPVKWPSDFPSETFPIGIVHENAALFHSGRLLTTDQWGDYIIYCCYPEVKVFVDGRSDFYGEDVGKDYLHLLQGADDWRAISDHYQFHLALLPVEWPLAAALKRDPAWRVVADDHRAVLMVHLGPQVKETK